jgi:transcriptional regulator with XRE-family HTH domain
MAGDPGLLARFIGETIRDRRARLKRTLRDVAARSGLSVGFLSDVERGKRAISVESLFKLGHGLDCEPADLLPGKWVYYGEKP